MIVAVAGQGGEAGECLASPLAGSGGQAGGGAALVFFLPGLPCGEDPLVADGEQGRGVSLCTCLHVA